MQIRVLSFSIALPGCRSLKEKRQRVGGLHERFGRNPAVAVCELGAREQHDLSEWSFVLVARSQRELDALCTQIEQKLERTVDGRLMAVHQEDL